MADEPLSALTTFSTYSTSDYIEILDVSDTTFAPTGTNKKIQFSTLLSMAGVGTVALGGTGLTTPGSASQLLGVNVGGTALEYKTLTAGSNITLTPGAGSITIAASGNAGTVSSVGLSLPSIISVSGSPVTGSGTLTGTLANQTANSIFAGPTTGNAVAPTFRALTSADLPSGVGTVTSVGLSVPSWLSVSGSPVTGSGAIAVSAATGQTANQFLATPNGSSGAVGLRAIAAADLPSTVVVTTGSYSSPSWLTAIAGSIVSGNIGGNAAGVTGSITTSQISNLSSWSGSSSVATVGTIASGIWQGTPVGIQYGGTGANLSSTGGSGNYLKQLTSGSAVSVGTIALADLPSITYGAIQNESASTLLGNPTGSAAAPSEITPYANMGFATVGASYPLRSGVPICVFTGAGTPIANSIAATSIFTGATLTGSLTIPANVLQVGSRLRIFLFGTFSTTSTPTLTMAYTLGGTSISNSGAVTQAGVSSHYWYTYDSPGFIVASIGSTGTIIGFGAINLAGSSAGVYTTTGGTAAPSLITINTTSSLLIGVTFQWGTASASNTIQLLGGAIYLD